MSAIYTYGQWIDIVDRGTSGDQVMDILASWKVNAYKLLEDNHKLESRIAELEAENAKLKAEIEQRADHESYLSQEFANTYYEKNARIAELEAERRWIPVGERLPEEKQDDAGETVDEWGKPDWVGKDVRK